MVHAMIAGTQVGAYRVLQQIGEGGMGSVWLAEHAMLGRRAAIKVLHAAFSAQPEIVTRFFNEARAATAISDPGIVQIFDFGNHVDGSAYIVMELLEGETLDKRLARLGRLTVADALRVMRQVASSLGAAHSRGILHRDLKPENIFLVRDLRRSRAASARRSSTSASPSSSAIRA
jgi:serine/threonine-protein kinase